jgi:predicted SAM-dependent methyltransferase
LSGKIICLKDCLNSLKNAKFLLGNSKFFYIYGIFFTDRDQMLKEIIKRIPFAKKVYRFLRTFGKPKRFCPICQKISSFGSAGVNPRQDALCYHCGSLERYRLVYVFLKEKMNFFVSQSKKMLHIAPEPCLEVLFKKTMGDGYMSADLYNPNAMIKMDIMDIQEEDEVFDIIYCSHVLEHVSDDRKAMREFFRILKKDGWAILNVPIIRDKTYEDPSIVQPEEREKAFGQNDHVRAYGLDYIDRLKEAGFSVNVTCAKDLLSESDIERMGLSNSWTGEIYLCQKPLPKTVNASLE